VCDEQANHLRTRPACWGVLSVYVTYFDEVKPVNEQQTYWIGGISVAIENIPAIEAHVSGLAEEVFGTSELTARTEFHGRDIYFAKAAFKGVEPQKRLELLSRLADILSDGGVVKRVYAAIDTTKLYAPEKADQFAFAHFCERVQMLVGKKHKTLLIGHLGTSGWRSAALWTRSTSLVRIIRE
jgi:hypothetical protein